MNRSVLATLPYETLHLGESLLNRIGNTPLVPVRRIAADFPEATVLGKAEWFNPGGSVKDRAALNMIREGERSGDLRAGKVILDATSGNTGIAYAMIGAVLGYKICLCLPANASPERKKILHAYGVELELTSPLEGSDGAIRRAREMYEVNPDKYFYPDQYSNDANWKAHYHGTAKEIFEQTEGRVTHFIAGLGTSGTFVGTGRRLRELVPGVKLFSFQPDSPFHGLEGMKHMATALVPAIYDPTVADEDLGVSTEDAYRMVKRLAKEEGLLVGVSAGGALAATMKVVERYQRGVFVTIFPDAADKYLSEEFWLE